MLLPVKPICPKNKVRRDGTSIIFIQYCSLDGKSTLFIPVVALFAPMNFSQVLRLN